MAHMDKLEKYANKQIIATILATTKEQQKPTLVQNFIFNRFRFI